MTNFRPIDRQTGYLLPPSVDEWLPPRHLARFVVEVIDGLHHHLVGLREVVAHGRHETRYQPHRRHFARCLVGCLLGAPGPAEADLEIAETCDVGDDPLQPCRPLLISKFPTILDGALLLGQTKTPKVRLR